MVVETRFAPSGIGGDAFYRVLIVDCAVSIGGTPIVSSHIATMLQDRGHAALVVTALNEEDARSLFPSNVETVLLKHPTTYDDVRRLKQTFRDPTQSLSTRAAAYLRNRFSEVTNLRFAFQLATLIKKFDADVVHVNNGLEPHMAAAMAGRSSVQQVHGLYPPKLSARSKAVLRIPKRFISISDVVAGSLRQAGIANERITVVPNFLMPHSRLPERHSAKAALGLDPNRPCVAIVGRVVGWKGQREFLRSMRHVAARVPNVQLMIVGDHSDGEAHYFRSVVELAHELQLKECTRFLGHQADPYIAYRAADVIAHCSLDPEPFGMVIIEAMEAGTPIVAANSGGPVEILEDGVSGYLADPRDAEAFAQPVVNLLLKHDLWDRLSRAARARFETHFTADAVYPQLDSIYRAALMPKQRLA